MLGGSVLIGDTKYAVKAQPTHTFGSTQGATGTRTCSTCQVTWSVSSPTVTMPPMLPTLLITTTLYGTEQWCPSTTISPTPATTIIEWSKMWTGKMMQLHQHKSSVNQMEPLTILIPGHSAPQQ